MKDSPLVLCLTNTVAANFTANCLLAIGAKPAMIEEKSEAAELASAADAILVNVGTLTESQSDVMRGAIRIAEERSIPWVLDPVACHCLSFRRLFVQELLQHHHPSIIRGNREEINFLRHFYANLMGTVPTLSTSQTDLIYIGSNPPVEIPGGVSMLQQITATGCAQGAICAAMLGWGQTPENVCISASKLMKTAGELAFKHSQLPGSFQVALVDALSELAPDFKQH